MEYKDLVHQMSMFHEYAAGLSIVYANAAEGKQCLWVTQGRERLKRTWRDVLWFCDAKDRPYTLNFKTNGGKIILCDARNIDQMRGISLDVIVVDNSVTMSRDLSYVIYPAIMDKGGMIFFQSLY